MTLLEPLGSLTGADPHWSSNDASPWFRLVLTVPPQGGWLSLGWDASLMDPVFRPLLMFIGTDETGHRFEADAPLAGTSFGRHSVALRVPRGTQEIRISPADRAGPFGFRLTEARWVSAREAFWRGLRSQPFMALHALGAALIGRRGDFRLLLTEAIQSRPLRHYAAWKRDRSRPPDLSGMDLVECRSWPTLHVVYLGTAVSAIRDGNLPKGMPILEHDVPDWSSGDEAFQGRKLQEILAECAPADMVMLVPEGLSLNALALPALMSAAAADPDCVIFYGDEEVVAAGGGLAPRFLTGFDPLWTFRALRSSATFAIRAGTLRQWLDGGSAPVTPRATALHRLVATRDMDRAQPNPLSALLDWLAQGWTIHQTPIEDLDVSATIIIPTRDRLELLRACLESVEPTLPAGTEIVIVDNESRTPETRAYLDDFAIRAGRKVVPAAGPFNFSRLCNLGAQASSGALLVFLNNDTTIVEPNWLRELARFAMKPEVGAVGARLLYPSGKVQHAGVILGIGGYAGHIDLYSEGNSDGAFGRARASHTLLAVTGACLAVERRKFEAVAGFDEVNLPVDLNDIDLCLRLREAGWQTVFAANAVLVHYESASRGRASVTLRYARERGYFAARWREARRSDPYFHPALSLQITRVSLG